MSAENLETLVWAPSPQEVANEHLWVLREVENIGPDTLQKLAARAASVRRYSYSPYSGYRVGAAILTVSGLIGDAANVEVVTYSETGHAEEEAAKKLALSGEIMLSGRRFIRAVAVAHAGTSNPCGRCRQVLAEFADNALILAVRPNGQIHRITSLKILLPDAFTPRDLGK